jgi:hypothetical protein
MDKDEALDLALEALETERDIYRENDVEDGAPEYIYEAITAIKQARAAPVQEPVSMRMPKVGDKVVCIEDESLGTVVYLTAGGSPEIKFDDGSHGTYMLREFAELFGYTTPPAAPVQEPVAKIKRIDEYGPMLDWYTHWTDFPVGTKLYTSPPAQPAPVQEPVWIQPDHLQKAQTAPFLCRVEPNKRDDFVPLYTTPPAAQRQWAGLTDEEIKRIGKLDLDSDYFGLWYDFAKAIEAKLRSKNG